MTLKTKSTLVSLISSLFFVVMIMFVLYRVLIVSFQEIENQRVERNIRRISAIVVDRFSQLNLKLSDWTVWDDTYFYLSDRNQKYVDNNLSIESFETIGVDEALFIDKNGILVNQIRVGNTYVAGVLNDVNKYFTPGSGLLKVNKESGYNSGILKTNEGILLFVVKDVFMSDGSGEPNGVVVFGRFFDKKLIDAMKDMTQFEAEMYLWDDKNVTSDYQEMKYEYEKNGKKSLVKVLNNNIISGYLVLEDVFGKPAVIVRSDIGRDIVLQGKESLKVLGILLLVAGIVISLSNVLLINGVVLKKILSMSSDVDKLGTSNDSTKRLKITGTSDEVDRLRGEINLMLDSLDKERQKGESLLDLINALVVMLNRDGNVVMINKRGLEMLGYSREEVMGKNWLHTFVPIESMKEVEERFEKIIEGNIKENEIHENGVLTKGNKILLISWHNSVIKDENGRVVSTLSLGDDITLQKEEEIKKEEYGKELERLNGAMVGRELRMIEMKNEINRLRKKVKKI
jgi:PAS domain S-box-containing protein